MNSFAFLAKAAQRFPNRPAWVHGTESVCYQEFSERALAVAGNLLKRGLVQGDRVAFCLANSPRIPEIIFGCFAAGIIVVPINSRLHAREMAYIVKNSGARLFIFGPEYHESLLENASAFEDTAEWMCLNQVPGTASYSELLESGRGLETYTDQDAA